MKIFFKIIKTYDLELNNFKWFYKTLTKGVSQQANISDYSETFSLSHINGMIDKCVDKVVIVIIFNRIFIFCNCFFFDKYL